MTAPIQLTPLQSCRLHGWLNPRRTLYWEDVCSSSHITLSRCLEIGLTPMQLKEMQPDVQMWIDFKGSSFQDVEAMLEWPLHPVQHLRGNLSDLASLHYRPHVLVKLGITYDYMRGVLNMDDRWMRVLKYTPKEWVQLGFGRQQALEMGRKRVEAMFAGSDYDALMLMVGALEGMKTEA